MSEELYKSLNDFPSNPLVYICDLCKPRLTQNVRLERHVDQAIKRLEDTISESYASQQFQIDLLVKSMSSRLSKLEGTTNELNSNLVNHTTTLIMLDAQSNSINSNLDTQTSMLIKLEGTTATLNSNLDNQTPMLTKLDDTTTIISSNLATLSNYTKHQMDHRADQTPNQTAGLDQAEEQVAPKPTTSEPTAKKSHELTTLDDKPTKPTLPDKTSSLQTPNLEMLDYLQKQGLLRPPNQTDNPTDHQSHIPNQMFSSSGPPVKPPSAWPNPPSGSQQYKPPLLQNRYHGPPLAYIPPKKPEPPNTSTSLVVYNKPHDINMHAVVGDFLHECNISHQEIVSVQELPSSRKDPPVVITCYESSTKWRILKYVNSLEFMYAKPFLSVNDRKKDQALVSNLKDIRAKNQDKSFIIRQGSIYQVIDDNLILYKQDQTGESPP